MFLTINKFSICVRLPRLNQLTTGTGEFDVMSGEFWIASVYDKMLPLDEFVERDSFGGDYIPTIWQPGPSGYFDGNRIGIPI